MSRTRMPLTAWLSVTAGAAPPEDYDEEALRTLTCRDCAAAWAAAREGRPGVLKLHADCRESLDRAAGRDFARSRSIGDARPRAIRLAVLRGVNAVRTAEVRP